MKNNEIKRMTAVDWLLQKLNDVKPTQFCSIDTIKEWCAKAKEIEKEQLIGAHFDGQYFEKCFIHDENHSSTEAEEYYKNYYGE